MAREISAVLEYGVPDPGETATMMEDKLRFHTDSWDLSVDLKAGVSEIIVIDARSRDAYAAGHIPGAISFPHREMSAETTAGLDRGKVYVVYCDGIGCNASTKGSHRLARLGFRTKELLGGDYLILLSRKRIDDSMDHGSQSRCRSAFAPRERMPSLFVGAGTSLTAHE